jgi:hypothetical protein
MTCPQKVASDGAEWTAYAPDAFLDAVIAFVPGLALAEMGKQYFPLSIKRDQSAAVVCVLQQRIHQCAE